MTDLNLCTIENNSSLTHTATAEVLKHQRIDSRLILQNMEEVLHTVKKKHREKHRRKKEQKKLALLESVDDGQSSAHLASERLDVENKEKHRKRTNRKGTTTFDQDSSNLENVSTLVCKNEVKGGNETGTSTPQTIANAFKIMMDARNRSIGSNTSGKELTSPPAIEENSPHVNKKNKLKLQELAEKRGGAKRRLEEESREAYVNYKLNARAKRFKKMLVNGNNPAAANSSLKIENKSKTKETRNVNEYSAEHEKLEAAPDIVDPETHEFLSKLNSPTKKGDTILGYFPKKDSAETRKHSKRERGTTPKRNRNVEKMKNAEYIAENKTPKRRGRPSKTANNTPLVEANDVTAVSSDSVSSTISARPRRTCAGKARYDYDLEVSPTKSILQEKKSKSSTKSPTPDKVNEVIDLDDSTILSSSTTTPESSPKKLAPVFVRTVPKPCPDPEIVKARKAFLASGVPERLRLEQEKQKQFEQSYEDTHELFPKIAHIRQISDKELIVEGSEVKVSYKLRAEEEVPLTSACQRSKVKASNKVCLMGRLSDCAAKDCPKITKYMENPIPLHNVLNKRDIIKHWKIEFARFPTYKCYNQMREKYRYFSAVDSAQNTEQVSESLMVTRGNRHSLEAQHKHYNDTADDEYKPPTAAPNGELLFTEKYKPLLFEQVLVNLNPVMQLKQFLSNWSSSPTSSRSSQNVNDNTLDENESSLSQHSQFANAIVLLGPMASGKTSAVFALANDMSFNVLEINAGMKRTGKRLLQELQEATQSHQIRKEIGGANGPQKHLVKLSINGLKSKAKRQKAAGTPVPDESAEDSSSGDLTLSARKCLILIEDADIVFEQTDAGFTDAIYSLAASSKRPVILVASNPNCIHLQRLITQNSIRFNVPNVLNITRYMSILSLMENCPIQMDNLISLYLYNGRDLRKTLLELQFFIQSGGDRHRLGGDDDKKQREIVSSIDNELGPQHKVKKLSDKNQLFDIYTHRSLFDFCTADQNMKMLTPYPVDFELLPPTLRDILQGAQHLKLPAAAPKESTTKSVKRKSRSPKKQWLNNATQPNTQYKPLYYLANFYENLSLGEYLNHREHLQRGDRLIHYPSEDMIHCLVEKSITVNLSAESTFSNFFTTHKQGYAWWKEIQFLQSRPPNARHLDYEPCLRAICRSEKLRCNQERRSTRFYHYLRNYASNITNFSNTSFDQACNVFNTSSGT